MAYKTKPNGMDITTSRQRHLTWSLWLWSESQNHSFFNFPDGFRRSFFFPSNEFISKRFWWCHSIFPESLSSQKISGRGRQSAQPRCPSWVSHVSPLPGPPIVFAAPGELPKRGVFGHMHRKESETGLLIQEMKITRHGSLQYLNTTKKIGLESRLRVRKHDMSIQPSILSSNHLLFHKGISHH